MINKDKMKRLLKYALLLLCGAIAWACSDDEETVDPGLTVTANNIAGTWRLATWRGEPLAEGSFVYFEFVRKDQTFKLYQNLASFAPVMKSGRFSITTDEQLGAAVIYGDYDHSLNEPWAHRYVVRDLTATSMTWIVTTDGEDISVYERCDAIPEEIVSACGEE